MAGSSKYLPLVGVLAFVVGAVGYFVFGWRFGGDSSPVAAAIAVVCVLLAVGGTLWDRL